MLQLIWNCFYQLLIFYFQPINSSANNLSTKILIQTFSSVRSFSDVQIFVTPWTAACQASLSINNCQSLLKLMSIESMMPSNHLILCHPLLLLPSIFPSIMVFSNELALRMKSVASVLEFQLQHQLFQWILISFTIDWFDLLTVEETLKSLL